MFNKSRIPDVPTTIDQHPAWLRHSARLAELQAAVQVREHELSSFEDARSAIASRVQAAQVAALLGEPDAAERVEREKQSLGEADAQTAAACERLPIQRLAVARVEAEGVALRESLKQEINDEVARVYLVLLKGMGTGFGYIAPFASVLRELRITHPTVATSSGVAGWDELLPASTRVGTGQLSKLAAWAAAARAAGADIPSEL